VSQGCRQASSGADVRLYVITDDAGRSAAELTEIISLAINGGATAVQFREKSAPMKRIMESWAAIADLCEAAGIPLLLNADILERAGDVSWPNMAGLHCGSRTVRFLGNAPAAILGYSAHSADEVQQATDQGAEFCTISPIYATPSKSAYLRPVGLQALHAARAAAPRTKVVALGGIDAGNAGDCILAGADGVAVMSAIMGAERPEEAARRIRDAIDQAAGRN
jgi:thiamine-phosphate pyrophosphorylase